MRTKIIILVLTLIALLLTVDALARPGGGSSFSGRSGSSSSSSSSSSGSFRSGSSSSSSSGSSYRSTSSSTSSSGSSYRSTSSSTSSSSSGGSHWGGSSTTSSSSSSGSTYTSTSSSTSSSGSYTGGSSYSGSSSGSYSGGGGSSSSDGSFGRGFLIFLGIALFSIALVIYLTRRKRNAEWATWQSREDAEREWLAKQAEEEARTQRYNSIDQAISAIKAHDEAFSYVLFEDFLYALYAEVHSARGEKGALERLSPYLGTGAVATYGNLPKRKLEAVVIGGMRVDSVEIDDDKIAVSAVFTSNVSEHGKKDEGETVRAWFMEERWKITRALGVKSRPPSRARTIGCPSCGAPLDKIVAGKCGYCNTTSAGGANDWFVEQIEILAREERGPMLTGTTEEVGTDLPTVVAKNANKRLEKLRESDPAFTWPTFVARVEKTFEKFHASWCAQDLTAVRPYLSDNLFELQRYWVKAYKDQKLRNLTTDAKVITVHLARVMRDKFYDSITVRVFATCIDYTVDAEDKVVGGRPNQVREYSEYWTFIRGVGKTGPPRTDGACPNCGAAFNSNADDPGGVNMSGTCTHCNVKITSGEFDWVLSRIEQDEVYEVAA